MVLLITNVRKKNEKRKTFEDKKLNKNEENTEEDTVLFKKNIWYLLQY